MGMMVRAERMATIPTNKVLISVTPQVQDTNDPFVEIAENGLNAFHKAEGVFLLNALPWLRVLPKFRELLDEGRKASTDMRRKPHEYSKKNVVSIRNSYEVTYLPPC